MKDSINDDVDDIITRYRDQVYNFIEKNQKDIDKIEYDVDDMLKLMYEEIMTTLTHEPKESKNYLVHLKIQDGEFEKSSKHLIHFVDTEEEAIEYAIRGESHDREDNTPPDEYGWYEDVGGQLMYRVEKVVEVPTGDFEVLKKYI